MAQHVDVYFYVDKELLVSESFSLELEQLPTVSGINKRTDLSFRFGRVVMSC